MQRSRRDLPMLVVALVGIALVAVALAVGTPSRPTPQLGSQSAEREPKRDTFSGLLGEMERKNVLSAAVDIGSSQAKVLYGDGRYVEVALPLDNGALLRQSQTRAAASVSSSTGRTSPPISRSAAATKSSNSLRTRCSPARQSRGSGSSACLKFP